MHRVGMMQGRLLPKVDGRIQAFPRERWEEEFPLLEQLGYEALELTIEEASWEMHPLRHADGRKRLQELSERHGVFLAGVCGDNFMEAPLVDDNPATRSKAIDQLLDLLGHASALHLGMVEVPMMGKNSLKADGTMRYFKDAMREALPRAEAVNVDIVLESDLPPVELASVMDAFDHPKLGINYDMGNSTWFGFEPEQELPLYHRHVRNVHVKDCTARDYSVPLGTGDTRLHDVFEMLLDGGYRGDFILQAARQDNDVQAGRDYLSLTKRLLLDAAAAGA